MRRTLRRTRRAVAGVVAATVLSACSYVPTRSLAYTPIPVDHAEAGASLLVRPLEDARGPREYHSMMGQAFLTYVPLIPYLRVPYERLDEIDVEHQSAKKNPLGPEHHFTRLFAEAIARDLESSGLFREVIYEPDARVLPAFEYLLSGTLRSTRFDQTVSSYLLGMAGVLLWLMPIPMAGQTAHVELDLELRDRSGEPVWSYRIDEQETRWYTLYNSGGQAVTSRYSLEIKRYGSNDAGIEADSFWAYHAAALREGMAGAKRSLAEFLAGGPEDRTSARSSTGSAGAAAGR